jgi:hypothetical protein
MDVDDLPNGLPPGSLVAPDPRRNSNWTHGYVYWVSVQPSLMPPGSGHGCAPSGTAPGCGQCCCPASGTPWTCDPGAVDALDAETILRDKWQYLVRIHQQTMGRLWMAEGPGLS